MRPGPDSLLERDPGLEKRFLALIKDGVPRKYAARACGFSYRTLYGWVRQGLVENAREPYRGFAERFYKTEVELLRKWLKKHEKASTKSDNRAIEWAIERRFPEAFGRSAAWVDDPADDLEKELDQGEASAGQLEQGGDGGALDTERWAILRAWFESRDPKLLELAIETGLAQAAVETTGGTKT